jgi:hypothetical protein
LPLGLWTESLRPKRSLAKSPPFHPSQPPFSLPFPVRRLYLYWSN